jgi:hypothetical protein
MFVAKFLLKQFRRVGIITVAETRGQTGTPEERGTSNVGSRYQTTQ